MPKNIFNILILSFCMSISFVCLYFSFYISHYALFGYAIENTNSDIAIAIDGAIVIYEFLYIFLYIFLFFILVSIVLLNNIKMENFKFIIIFFKYFSAYSFVIPCIFFYFITYFLNTENLYIINILLSIIPLLYIVATIFYILKFKLKD